MKPISALAGGPEHAARRETAAESRPRSSIQIKRDPMEPIALASVQRSHAVPSSPRVEGRPAERSCSRGPAWGLDAPLPAVALMR